MTLFLAMGMWANRAVVVIHGIGVQRRNATLAGMIRGFKKAGVDIGDTLGESAPFGEPIPPDAVRISRDGVDADVYEVYWAPYTSHKTTAGKVLGWLLKNTFIPGKALRKPSPKAVFDIGLATVAIAAALWVVLVALSTVGNLSTAASCAARDEPDCGVPYVESGLSGERVTANGLGQLTSAGRALLDAIEVVDEPLQDFSPRSGAAVLQAVTLYTWLFLVAVIFVTFQALYRLIQLVKGSGSRPTQLGILAGLLVLLAFVVQPVPPVMVAFGWVVAVVWALKRLAASFLAESLGDVQVYAEKDENSVFFGARERVLTEAERVLELVGEREYQEIVVFGHSLGSVIALDALRRLNIRNPVMATRIDAFVTFGTAIEKNRYFFEREAGTRGRAAFERSVHAVVGDCAWLNLWYWNDVVANPITSFHEAGAAARLRWGAGVDLAETLERARREFVVNISFGAPLTPAPVWTHSKYWDDERVLGILATVALPPRPRITPPIK